MRASVMLDEVDARIVELLQENARRGNRGIAREIDVSEATVRYRVRKLVDTGAICFTVLQDPFAIGLMTSAFLRMVVSMPRLQAIRDWLIDRDETVLVASTSGRFNLVTFLQTRDEAALREFVSDEVAAIKGVWELDVRTVVQAVKYDWRMVTIPPRQT